MSDIKYAHIQNGVIYNIDEKQYDNKSTDDILINADNCPKLVFSFVNKNTNDTYQRELLLIDLIEDGDEYKSEDEGTVKGPFKINSEIGKCTSYFAYAQYKSEVEHVNQILVNGTYNIPFYLSGTEPKGEVNFTAKSTASFNLTGEYTYSFDIKNDGDNKFVSHDISEALVNVANEKAKEIIYNGQYKFKKDTSECIGISADAIEPIK